MQVGTNDDGGNGTFETPDAMENAYLSKTRNKIRLTAILDFLFTLGIVIILAFVLALHNGTGWTLLLLFQFPHVFSSVIAGFGSGTNSATGLRFFRYYMLVTAVLDVISFVIRLILLIECFDSENGACLGTGIQSILFLLYILILIFLDALQLIWSYMLETELKRKFGVLMGSVPVSGNPSYDANPAPPLPTPTSGAIVRGARYVGVVHDPFAAAAFGRRETPQRTKKPFQF
jgi:hypothetical protein